MAEVTLDNVRKVYDNGHVGVAGATFTVRDGELLVLVGPSGCGKTTTLRMIAGLESITSGTLTIGGKVVNDVAPKDRDIAMVFQNYALYPHMSVAENLGFALTLRGEPRAAIDERVRAAAEQLELSAVLDRLPRALSGGQRQRVALGRALVRQPAVFLLDEPLSNLDAKLRLSTRQQIARLHRRLGATMVYVTHDQIEAMTLGERIVVFRSGAIQQIDTPMALYARPANVFVAGFLGSPAMNFVRGKLTRDGGWRLVADGVTLALGAREDLAPYAEREVIVGVRPEDLRLGAGTHAIDAQLDMLEPVGNEVFLHLRAGAYDFVARTPPGELPPPGSTVTLQYDAAKLHVFDAATELRVIERAP